MAVERYELSDAQWLRIASLLPAADPGRSGAHWCDLAERYGKWKTLHRRFAAAGAMPAYGSGSSRRRRSTGQPQYLMIDSTIVRAHQQASTGKEPVPSLSKQGPRISRWALPKRTDDQACPGACRRVHMLADTFGHPFRFRITPVQASDIASASALPEGQRAKAVLADKAYDGNDLRARIAAMKAGALIPSRRNRKIAIPHDIGADSGGSPIMRRCAVWPMRDRAGSTAAYRSCPPLPPSETRPAPCTLTSFNRGILHGLYRGQGNVTKRATIVSERLPPPRPLPPSPRSGRW